MRRVWVGGVSVVGRESLPLRVLGGSQRLKSTVLTPTQRGWEVFPSLSSVHWDICAGVPSSDAEAAYFVGGPFSSRGPLTPGLSVLKSSRQGEVRHRVPSRFGVQDGPGEEGVEEGRSNRRPPGHLSKTLCDGRKSTSYLRREVLDGSKRWRNH